MQESTVRPAFSTKSRRLSQVEVSSVFLGVTESVARRSASSSSSLVSADVSEGAGRPPGARGRHVELAHRRAGLVHPGEGQGQRACKFRQFSLHAVTIYKGQRGFETSLSQKFFLILNSCVPKYCLIF